MKRKLTIVWCYYNENGEVFIINYGEKIKLTLLGTVLKSDIIISFTDEFIVKQKHSFQI